MGESFARPGDVKEAFANVIAEEVRRRIVDDGVRPDGRGLTEIRPLAAEAGIIPRVHGSGLFKRGQTQVLTIATLGTPRDAQELDTLSPEETSATCTTTTSRPTAPAKPSRCADRSRREIGHGALAEAALRAMIPPEDVFPYTIRLVSEVLSSNGSTSMASVCGSTLALMDAGVPIKRPVGGIAMGLIKEGDKVAVLTDIQGMEDHLGDMDFKVAGTINGITALQMDIKISGVSDDIMRRRWRRRKAARLQILDVILSALPEPRAEPERIRAAHDDDQDRPGENRRGDRTRRQGRARHSGSHRRQDRHSGRRHGLRRRVRMVRRWSGRSKKCAA